MTETGGPWSGDDPGRAQRRVGPYEQSLRDSARRIQAEAERRQRQASRRKVLGAVVAAALVAGGGFGAWRFLVGRDAAPTPAGGQTTAAKPVSCQDPTLVTVAVPPAAVPAITSLTEALSTHPSGPCAAFELTPVEAYAAAGTLGGPRRPDAWITDSAEWVSRASAVTGRTLSAAEPFASAAVVLAMPTASADKLGSSVSWTNALTQAGQARVMDPNRSAVGAAVLGAASAGLSQTGIADVVRAAATAGPADLAGAAAAQAPVAVTAPQLLAHNAASGATQLAAVAPTGGTAPISYSLVTVTTDAARAALITELGSFLASEEARELLADSGYRTPGQDSPRAPTPLYGVIAAAAPPTAQTTAAVRASWRFAVPPTRALLAVDTSGSMLDKVGRRTRMELVQDAIAQAAAGMSQTDQLAIWAFSQHIGPDHTDDRSLRISAGVGAPAQLADTTKAIAALEGVVGGGSGLYDTIRTAYGQARSGFQSGASNRVVVVVDGPNEDDYGLTLAQLKQQLSGLRDSRRPIAVTIIGVGDRPEAGPLAQIAAVVGGRYVAATDPAEVSRALGAALG